MYDDRLHDSCGVFGIHAPGHDVARLTFFGLYALQHRGQESAGIAVSDDGQVTVIKDLGLVSQVFNEQMLQSLSGQHAIGHVRYSTTGASHWQNSQPLVRSRNGDVIALGHNGNLVNTTELRDELVAQGVKFSGTTDTEVITALIAHESEGDLLEGVRTAVSKIRGAFSAAVMSGGAVVGFRDPYGVRPLCLGDYEGHPVFSSETSGLDIIGADFVREIQPGEIVIADKEHGLRSERVELEGSRPALCIFEFIYFARPDSVMNGKTLHVVRQNMGRQLSMEAPVEADLVVPVPDTGMPAAIGYAAASGIPYTEGLIKNRYVHRTFIQPDDNLRQVGIRMKLNPLTSVIKGKRLIVVDDSIVRGNTTRRLVAHAVRRRRRRGAPAHQLAAHPVALLLRHRHGHARRAHRVQQDGGRDPRPRRRHQPALPHARRPPGQHRPAARAVLPRLLRRRLPHRGARGVRDVQDALREGRGRSRLRPLIDCGRM